MMELRDKDKVIARSASAEARILSLMDTRAVNACWPSTPSQTSLPESPPDDKTSVLAQILPDNRSHSVNHGDADGYAGRGYATLWKQLHVNELCSYTFRWNSHRHEPPQVRRG